MLKSFLIANVTAEAERDRVNAIWKQTTTRLLELDKEEPADAVPLLRERLDEVEETFDTNPTLRLHQQNRYSLKWLLARMTDHIEVRGGLASRFEEYVSEGRKNGYEVEHIGADHWEQHQDEFTHETDFDEYRNRLGGLLLPKTFNSSYNDWSYAKKLPKYLEQNLLARSLNPDTYDRNPPLKKLKQAGLPFAGHREFKKVDIETRQNLYVAIAKQVWNPNRLNEAAGVPPGPATSSAGKTTSTCKYLLNKVSDLPSLEESQSTSRLHKREHSSISSVFCGFPRLFSNS